MLEVTFAAAARVRVAARAAGVDGVPGVRFRRAAERGEGLELVVEDRREPGDEVFEARGIRFYLDGETASKIDGGTLDLEGVELVVRSPTQGR